MTTATRTDRKRPAAKKAAPKKAAPKKARAKRAVKKSTAGRSAGPPKSQWRLTVKERSRRPASARNREDARKHRLRVAVALTTVSVFAFALLSVVRSPMLDVDRVTVSGNSQASSDEIVAAARVPIGTPLLEVDIDLVKQRVTQVPWVQSVEVARSWSGELKLEITERVAILSLPAEGGYALIDRAGRQLEVVTERPEDFLPVEGVVASGQPGNPAPPETTAVLELMTELTPTVRMAMDSVLIDRGSLSVGLTDGGRVLFGSSELLADKVVSLETMLQYVDLRCLREIDVRVPAAPALSRIGESGNPTDTLADLTKCS